MKISTLVAGILALFPLYACAQSEAVQVYARLNLGFEAVHAGATSGAAAAHTARLSNYRSVLGLRGSEPLGGELRLVYQVEGTLAPDTGSGAIAARDTRVGFEGAVGTLFAGNWTTPYTSITSALDPFYPTTAGYMSIMGNGSAPSASNLEDPASFDRRQKNSLHYWTPDWRGLSLRLARGLGEERPANGASPRLDSAALVLERDALYAALAHERHRAYHAPGRTDRGTKLALAYQFGRSRIALVRERLDYRTGTGELRRDAWFLALTRQFGQHALKLGVAKAMDGRGSAREAIGAAKAGPQSGALHATIGYDVALSKRTTLFAFHTRVHNDANAIVDFGINGLAPAPGAHLRGTALGLRHAF